MNPQWQQFLSEQGAIFEDNDGVVEISGFEPSNANATSPNKLTAIGAKGVISVTGRDAKKFLQGQLTCNLDDVDEQHTVLGALCSYQGKTITNFRVLLDQDTCYLIMHASLIETVMNYLKKYIAFSKAEMSDVSDQFVLIGCWGEQIEQILQSELGLSHFAVNEVRPSKLGLAVHITDTEPCFEFMSSLADGQKLWGKISGQCEKVPSRQWMLTNIRNGFAEISAATSEQFIPQMLNLDLIGAISFKKGCYTGQEIIARSHYLGKQKRRMFRLRSPSGVSVKPGMEIFVGGTPQPAGKVINAAVCEDGGYEILAILKVQSRNDLLHLEQPNTEKLSLLSLPYAIPIQE